MNDNLDFNKSRVSMRSRNDDHCETSSEDSDHDISYNIAKKKNKTKKL